MAVYKVRQPEIAAQNNSSITTVHVFKIHIYLLHLLQLSHSHSAILDHTR